LRKLSPKAAKNWQRNSGAKRRVFSRENIGVLGLSPFGTLAARFWFSLDGRAKVFDGSTVLFNFVHLINGLRCD